MTAEGTVDDTRESKFFWWGRGFFGVGFFFLPWGGKRREKRGEERGKKGGKGKKCEVFFVVWEGRGKGRLKRLTLS